MSKRKSITHILRTLPERKESVVEVLSHLVKELSLPQMLGEDASWAVVGGCLRDWIISGHRPHTVPMLVPWPDVDVAVGSTGFSLSERAKRLQRMRMDITRNSYGGWKAEGHGVEIDVWRLPRAHRGTLDLHAWDAYLETIDFTLNAVAFVWPQKEVVMHEDWETSLERRQVEKLSPCSPRPELLPIRAVALSTKLSQFTPCSFSLCSQLKEDLRVLASRTNHQRFMQAMHYLRRKIESNRWDSLVLDNFVMQLTQLDIDRDSMDLVKQALGIRANIGAKEQDEVKPPKTPQLDLGQ